MTEYPLPVSDGYIGARMVVFDVSTHDDPIPEPIRPRVYFLGGANMKQKFERAVDTHYSKFKSIVLTRKDRFTSRDFEPDFPMKKASVYLNRMCERKLIHFTGEKVPTQGKGLQIFTVNP